MGGLLSWLTQVIGSPRAEEVLERIRRGEAGPFLGLSQAEKVWLARQLLDISSNRLSAMLGMPERTIRFVRRHWAEDARARRNDRIWELYLQGWPVTRIAEEVGLSRQWVHRIIRARRAGHRLAYHRLIR